MLGPTRYPLRKYPAADAEAIVVLAGSAIYPTVPPVPAPRVGSDTYERCEYAAWLFKNWRALPLLVSGGTRNAAEVPPYATAMRDAVRKEGVPDTMIWLEDKSRTTRENAIFSAALLRSKGITRIVLVTDAYHMLRAERSFRKLGMQVIPAACGYRTFHQIYWDTILPGWEAIDFNEDSMHEYIGLAWYWIHGWI